MSDDDGPRQQVFLVRMWPAPPAAGRQAWRGAVQHVASGRKLYISGLADIVEFITTELSESATEDRSAR